MDGPGALWARIARRSPREGQGSPPAAIRRDRPSGGKAGAKATVDAGGGAWGHVQGLRGAIHQGAQCRLAERQAQGAVDSVPYGGGKGAKQQWIENEFDRLDRFARIYIATDMDGPGHDAAEEIANRLGRHRCLRVHLPRKDANECLVDAVSKEEIDRAIAEAANLDPEGLSRPSGFADAVKHLFWPAPGEHVGYKTPYGKLNDGVSPKLLFRPGEVTLWSGASGAGKSQILSDCIVDWVHQGSRICLSSLEMKAAQTPQAHGETGGRDRQADGRDHRRRAAMVGRRPRSSRCSTAPIACW